MNENQTETKEQNFEVAETVPVNSENSVDTKLNSENDSEKIKEGQSLSQDPSKKLLLGKFKSVEELSKAYEELQKRQGKSSDELGSLRKELANLNSYKDIAERLNDYQTSIASIIERDKELYNTPEYLQNPVFKEIYSEALTTFGDNLDTDRLVGLLEKYVENRISAYDKQISAKSETQNILDSMTYSKNPQNTLTPPKKTLNEMTEEEFKVSLRKLI